MMAMGGLRSAGMVKAIEAAGGVRALARKLGCQHSVIARMRRVPKARLFEFARATGVEAEVLRPDLATWVEAERERQWMERARSRFSIAAPRSGPVVVSAANDSQAGIMDLLDLGLVMASLQFAAGERGLTTSALLRAPVGAGGAPTPEQSARSLAMGVAVAVGRVSPELVARVLGVTRQAVSNAAERYLRARDGDDVDDLTPDGRVIERGRARHAKVGDPAVYAAERRFVGQLAGGVA